MTVTATPVFPQTIQNYKQTFVPADTTTIKTLATAGSNGTKIEAINVVSTDTSGRDLQFYVTVSATNYLLTTVNIPATAGTVNSVVSVDILRHSQFPSLAYDVNGNKYLYLANGASLTVGVATTVTAAKQITVFGQGEDF